MIFSKLFKKHPTVRTRFAPSPTGYVHIGNLRNALYCFLFAKKHKGQFILRIEDTDQKRYVEDAMIKLIKTLEIFGLHYDEGPVINQEGHIAEKGKYQSYIQSNRLDIYRAYAEKLVASGYAYYSFKTETELDEIRKELSKTHTVLKQKHLNEQYSATEVSTKVAQGDPFVIRLKTPESGKVSFTDLVKGKVEFDFSGVDDSVLIKSDGYPTYHLASVVDDHLMKISHVIRSDEWLSSAPKHLLLYKALGFEAPQFAHLPLILNPDKTKLSKRQGDVAAEDYLKKGYLPQAILNFVALLGWNPGEGETEEIFSVDELIKRFDFTHVNKAGAVFDIKKLQWMNSKYLREHLSLEDFIALVKPAFQEFLSSNPIGKRILASEKSLRTFAQIARERIEYLAQLKDFFAENTWLNEKLEDYPAEKLQWKKADLADAKTKLTQILPILESIEESDFTKENLEQVIKEWIKAQEYPLGNVLWPLRVALTSQDRSPNPFEVSELLGKQESLARVKSAIEKIA